MNIKDIFTCWDFIASLFITLVLYLLSPHQLTGGFLKDFYGIGISVLSIVFSVYFAALAIIISSSDDDFVRFLESEGHYTAILGTFKFAIFMIFIALVYFIILFSVSTYKVGVDSKYTQSYLWLISSAFLFSYSLFCVFNSTIDALKYSHYRVQFLEQKNNDDHII